MRDDRNTPSGGCVQIKNRVDTTSAKKDKKNMKVPSKLWKQALKLEC